MSEPETAQEPTMEEILASIRRIISEDDGGGNEPAEAASEQAHGEEDFAEEAVYQDEAHQQPAQTQPTNVQPVELQAVAPSEERETSNPDSERYASITAVFSGRQREQADELEEFGDEYETEGAYEAEGVVEVVAEEEPAPETGAAFEPDSQPELQTQGESQYEAEEPSVDDVEAFFGNDNDEAVPEFAAAEFGEPVSVEDQVAAATTHQVSFEAAARDAVEEEVLSPDTETRVASLLGQLNEPEAAEDSASASAAGSSVEGMVREMLRPMLQRWLDDNLPSMVERIVEREIKRVTRAR